jgi:hypothetical protein
MVGKRLFIACHHKQGSITDKHFVIRKLMPDGYLGYESESQEWNSDYETFFGFNVGSRGFIFGLDSYTGHRHWFVQEVTSDGTLAEDEACSGDWAHFWETATPMYVNGNTYLFFHRKAAIATDPSSWFISQVTSEGVISDHQTGYWENFWDAVTSVEISGNTYLIGHNQSDYDYFIQRINSDGTMGDETEHGNWTHYYSNLTAYVSNGKAYLIGAQGTNTMGDPRYFIQEITSDGHLGAETFNSSYNEAMHFVFTFPFYNQPGSFRYCVGWDLSATTGTPSGWSSRHDDPWNGATKLGGGAAINDIDGDAQHRPDAVFMGIQSLPGPDRYYYKVAWNLNITGIYTKLSQTIFGPEIGEGQAGGGADLADIDGNGKQDLVLMNVSDPGGDNSFQYQIGWNLGTDGVAASWSSMIQGPSLGTFNSGGGLAIGYIDNNTHPDMVLIGIDNPAESNSFWYAVGRNLYSTGTVTSWSQRIVAPCYLGWLSSGGGAALADVNGNGIADLVLMNIDSPPGPDGLWCYIGWDVNIDGQVTGWSLKFSGDSFGYITSGGGVAVGEINMNGTPDLLIMTIDDPFGTD